MTVDFPPLGSVEIVCLRNARRFIARWRDGHVVLTVPPAASGAEISAVLSSMEPRLLAHRPAPRPLYTDGMLIEQPGIRVCIRKSAEARGGIRLRGSVADAEVLVDPAFDLDAGEVRAAISSLLMRVARHRAAVVLIGYARVVASQLAVKPSSWHIGRGLRTLGHCNARGEISLSAALMFAPEHLRRYVICHELAHLTELNHSQRFHALCDNYCGGRGQELAAELRAYHFPLHK